MPGGGLTPFATARQGRGRVTDLLAVFGDLHSNSTIALCPPKVELDDGGFYQLSPSQEWVYAKWGEFWGTVRERWKAIPKRKRGKKGAIFMGDAVENFHHGTVQLVTPNPTIQKRIAVSLLEPVRDWADYMIMLRGTQAHSGPSGANEEDVAEVLRADKDGGNYTWWNWQGEIEGVLMVAAHHPGSRDGKQYTAGGAANRVAAGLTIDFAGGRLPQLALFGHNHLVGDSGINYPIRVLISPAWALKNSFVHAIGRTWSLSTIGGWILTCNNGHYNAEAVTYKAEREAPWTPG